MSRRALWPWVAVAMGLVVFARIRSIGLVGLDTLPILAASDARGALTERLLPHHNMFRPLFSLSVALDRALYGLWAPGFQLTNALCCTAAGLALGHAARVIAGTPLAALAAVLLFFAHPALVDVVPAVERRGELLAVTFLALCAVAAARAAERAPKREPEQRRTPSLAPLYPTALGLLAMGSKDNGLIALPIAAAAAFACGRGTLGTRARHALRVAAPLAVATALFALWRARIVGGLGGQRAMQPLELLGQHPHHVRLYLDRLLRPEPFASAETATGVLVVLAAASCAAALWLGRGSARGQARSPWRAALVGLVWIECAFLTYSVRGMWRLWYLLIPAAGLALALAGVTEALAAVAEGARPRARRVALAALLALGACFGWQARHSLPFGSLEPWRERTRRIDAFYGELAARLEDPASRGSLVPCPQIPETIDTPPGPGYFDNVRDVTPTTIRAFVALAFPELQVRLRPTDQARVRDPDEVVLVHPGF